MGKSRWIGRAAILPSYPNASEWVRFLALTICFVGVQLLWSCEMAQASPYLLSLGLSKSAMSVVFLAGPLSGLIVQPLVGVLSDSCRSRIGRRRPFIIGGCIVSSLAVMLLGWAKEVASIFSTNGTLIHSRLTISFAILSIYIIDFSINVVQAMDRSLLVDLVPPHLQAGANAWASRLFGFGAVAGYYIGGLDLVKLTNGFLGSSQLKVLTLFTATFLCCSHAITACCVTERVLISNEDDAQQEGLSSLKIAMMDIWSTLRELPDPMQQVLNVQFTSWIGWFPVLFFSTTWVAEVYTKTHGNTDLVSATPAIQSLATRAGSRALLFQSIVSLLTSIVLPILVAPSIINVDNYSPSRLPKIMNQFERFLPSLPLSWLSLPLLWTFSNGCFAILLLATYFATNVTIASVVIAAFGFSWALTNWLPFAILGDLILRSGQEKNHSNDQLWDAPDMEERDETHLLVGDKLAAAIELHPLKLVTSNLGGIRSTSPTPSDHSSEAYFDAGPDTPTQAEQNSKGLLNPYPSRDSPRRDLRSDSLQIDPFSSTTSFHLEPYSSSSSLGNDPYASNSTVQFTDPATILSVRHSDSFDYENEQDANNIRRESRRESSGITPMRNGSIPTLSLGDESMNQWSGEGEEDDEGAEKAGVILGCHNIYLVVPQFIVTGLSSIIFAVLAPHHNVLAGSHALTTEAVKDSTSALLDGVDIRAVAQEVVTAAQDWDALGMIFRIGGVSAAISTYLSWRMTSEREKDRLRILRGID